jgi:LPXTG-motif cell wall-anchored protein
MLAATGGEAPWQLAIWGIAFLAAGAVGIARRRVAD